MEASPATMPVNCHVDSMDEMILKLVSVIPDLKNQDQQLTEKVNQKVMEAARICSKGKDEHKALMIEKEEERLRNQKEIFEANTNRKLSELEKTLGRKSAEVERVKAAVGRAEIQNAALKQELESAKSYVSELASRLEDVARKEKENVTKFELLEKLKARYSEELAAEKHKVANLKKKLEQAEYQRKQLEARLNEEVKAKEGLLLQTSALKKEREKFQASVKSREGIVKSRESSVHKLEDEFQKLELEISKQRLMHSIATHKRVVDASYASRPTGSRNISDVKDYSGRGSVERDRECVMCLSEEMSVVFLPCAHQVLCTTCNELHEKQGKVDCPSCRRPIQQRFCARYGSS